jgi:hypothetical protein
MLDCAAEATLFFNTKIKQLIRQGDQKTMAG